jgi:hypothetical protein
MARRSSSSSSGAWRYLNPAYYLKRPKRLALLFFVFVAATFAFWDRQSLVSEYEVRPPAPLELPLIRVGRGLVGWDLIGSFRALLCVPICRQSDFVAGSGRELSIVYRGIMFTCSGFACLFKNFNLDLVRCELVVPQRQEHE